MRAPILALLLLAPLHAFERWVYIPATFHVYSNLETVARLLP